nr:MAG TPA: hypothetical protein [Crassvirales sp.]DAU06293.1 MAG TPA: hypothetical protein [Caudoviricetes sp.]DAX21722.1 MAG TPA: hypothetical protein [Caudoviricetes sp.]
MLFIINIKISNSIAFSVIFYSFSHLLLYLF